MKRIRWISRLLCIAMLVSMLPLSAFAESGSSAPAYVEPSESVETAAAVSEAPAETSLEKPQHELRQSGSWNGTYLDCDSNGDNWESKSCTDGATLLTSSTTSWESGWYVASGNVTISSQVTVTGDVKLILEDGASLTINASVCVENDNALTIYAQSTGNAMGKLDLNTGSSSAPAIGGITNKGGSMTFNGGQLSIAGDPAISVADGTLVINGGIIDAKTVVDSHSVIGAEGFDYAAGSITLNGGTVNATSSCDSACAIGYFRLSNSSTPSVLNLNGGTLVANTKYGAISSSVAVNVGADFACKVTAGSNVSLAEVQEYSARTDSSLWSSAYLKVEPCVNHVSVTGSAVYVDEQTHTSGSCRFCGVGTAEPHSYDAGTSLCVCGAWQGSYLDCDANGKNWEAKTVTGMQSLAGNAATITSGWYAVVGEFSIAGLLIKGDVKFILADGASLTLSRALRVDSGNSLTIYAQSAGNTMGKLTASGTRNYPGIGGDEDAGIITINGGEINAQGGYHSPGIGGGSDGNGGVVTINGGVVTAQGAAYAPGIGGGAEYSGTNAAGTVTINGGTVIAKGTNSGRGIGSGYYYISGGTRPGYVGGSGGTVTINGGSVLSIGGINVDAEGTSYYRTPQAYDTAPTINADVSWLQTFGTSESDLTRINFSDLSGEEYVSYAAVKLEGCPHSPDAGAQYIDEQTHASPCAWCGMASGGAAHSFDEDGFCVCGAWKASYLNCDEAIENWATESVVGNQRICSMSSGELTLEKGWYLFSGDQITLGDSEHYIDITVKGEVKLLLPDNKNIKIYGNILADDPGSTLKIYAQSAGENSGSLWIEGTADSTIRPSLTIYGGKIEVVGSNAAISSLTLNGGNVLVSNNNATNGPVQGSLTLNGGSLTVSSSAGGDALSSKPTTKSGTGWRFFGGTGTDGLTPFTATEYAALESLSGYPAVRFDACSTHTADTSNESYPVEVNQEQHKNICKWCGVEYLTDHVFDAHGMCVCGKACVSYLVYDATNGKWEEKQCSKFTTLTTNETTWSNGWYVAVGNIEINNPVTLDGNDVHLIVRDGATLSLAGGIAGADGTSLTIYAQSSPSVNEDGSISNGSVGVLNVGSAAEGSAIVGGSLTVMGGVINVAGQKNGVECPLNAYGGRITVNTGTQGTSFTVTPTLCGSACWKVSAGAADVVTPVEKTALTESTYHHPAVTLDPCMTHVSNGVFTYIDAEHHSCCCKWCATSLPEAHSYTEEGNCVCGAWKGRYKNYSDYDKLYPNVNVSGVRPLTSEDTEWTAGTYAVIGDVTIDSRVTVSGDVLLIITRSGKLTINGGIEVNDNATDSAYNTNILTVARDSDADSQSEDQLIVQNVPEHCAGIGGGAGKTAGTIRLFAGNLTISGGAGAAGVGGGYGGGSGRILLGYINSTIQGGDEAVAIGAGVGGTVSAATLLCMPKLLIASGASAFDAAPLESHTLHNAVYAGDSADTLTVVTFKERTDEVYTGNKVVKLTKCDHPEEHRDAYRYDDYLHTPYCTLCNLSFASDLHTFTEESNGICTRCGAYEPASINSDFYYEISNAGQFLWFTHWDSSGNGKLISNISFKNIDYVPVSTPYCNIFDGNGYTISDLNIVTGDADSCQNYGLFGALGDGALIKDLTLRGSITCTVTTTQVGGVAGFASGGAAIRNVQCYVNISDGGTKYDGMQYIGGIVGQISDDSDITTVENSSYHGSINITYGARIGGICGFAGTNSKLIGCINYGKINVGGGYHTGGIAGGAQNTRIERCLNAGTVEMHSHDCLGGVVGYSMGGTVIQSCGNVGAISGYSTNPNSPDAYVGGILGYINNTDFGCLSNCYNYGDVTASAEDTYCGAIIGWGRKGATADKILNNYYLVGEKAVGATNDTTVTAASATLAQFASGEIAYKLNGGVTDGTQAWYQELTDAAKKDPYPVPTGKTVYQSFHNCDESVPTIYTNDSTDPAISEKRPSHTYVNGVCMDCGTVATADPVFAEDLTFISKSLSLQSCTAFVVASEYTVLNTYDHYYVVFQRDDASTGTTDIQVARGATSTAYAAYHAFKYPVYSYMMTDDITATIYGVKDGVTYVGETYTKSVRSYVLEKIADASEPMKAVCANLLNYGARAQELTGYKVDDLATAGLGEYESYIAVGTPVTTDTSSVTSDGYHAIGLRTRALGLNEAVELQFVLKKTTSYTQDQLYAVYSFERNGETVTGRIEGADFTVSAGHLVVKVDALTAMEGNTPVSVTIYSKADDSRLSETWTYSIASHVSLKVPETPTTQQHHVLIAMMNYYNAVAAAY